MTKLYSLQVVFDEIQKGFDIYQYIIKAYMAALSLTNGMLSLT